MRADDAPAYEAMTVPKSGSHRILSGGEILEPKIRYRYTANPIRNVRSVARYGSVWSAAAYYHLRAITTPAASL